MDLADLATYAEQKYNIQEQSKWTHFLGFSVLAAPKTGKWLALLMRRRDSQSGAEMQLCDIKCGRYNAPQSASSFVTAPFRMKGPEWAGVIIGDCTEAEIVFQLFDRAVQAEHRSLRDDYRAFVEGETFSSPSGRLSESKPSGNRHDYTIELADTAVEGDGVYRDTALPFAGRSRESNADRGVPLGSKPGQREGNRVEASRQSWNFYVPAKITEMLGLYEYGDGSFKQKCRNFYRQGKYMEDYEDDFIGNFPVRQFYPTYHDLNVQQLRCYFAWRSAVRKGEYRPISLSLAYIYLYELLCAIGTSSPQDGFNKMREFSVEFVDAGFAGNNMRQNLYRWMFEFAIMHNLPGKLALEYANPDMLADDSCLAVLKTPRAYTDDEILSALAHVADNKFSQSPAVAQGEAKGRHLFAEAWRYLAEHYRSDGRADGQDFFTVCFGKPRAFERHLLENAIHWEEGGQPDREYALNESRSYRCRGGRWYMIAYDILFANEFFQAFIHETDRVLRKHLKTGHYLRKKAEEAWVTPYVEAVIAAEEKAAAEAARPKISIDFGGLEQIRREAQVTKESLLTAEELGENIEAGGKPETHGQGGNAEELKENRADRSQQPTCAAETKALGVGNETNIVFTSNKAEDAGCVSGAEEPKSDRGGVSGKPAAETDRNPGPAAAAEDDGLKCASALSAAEKGLGGMPAPGNSGIALDAVHAQILTALLQGRSIDEYIKQRCLMPALVAETINAAFYEEIGDNVLECEGEILTLVEDYTEDIRRMINII
ncbi:MAG: TerB N-terminal domain-containing protein [bacterium]|nr:TerB N-terminal domain-containing protein [bacterium]